MSTFFKIKNDRKNSTVLNSSTVISLEESTSNSCVNTVHFVSNYVRVGNYKYCGSVDLKIILSEKGYIINLPVFTNNGKNFVNDNNNILIITVKEVSDLLMNFNYI